LIGVSILSFTFAHLFCHVSCLIYLCFFLHSIRHHLDLHSFPTRRSSDLTAVRGPAFPQVAEPISRGRSESQNWFQASSSRRSVSKKIGLISPSLPPRVPTPTLR